MRYLTYLSFVVVVVLSCLTQANGEDGILVIHVTDVSGKPMAGVVITATGDSSQPETDNAGKARIKLGSQTQPNEEVTLSIVRSPRGKNFVFVSPWNSRVRIPPFDNKSQNVTELVIVEAGDRVALENNRVLIALVSRINEANAIRTVNQSITKEQRAGHLIEVARLYELDAIEVDQAIREWGSKTKDPFEKGLSAMYAENYPEATKQLTLSMAIRRTELTASREKVLEVASFLGESLLNEGKYKEAASAYKEALDLSPNDSNLLNGFALSLFQAGDDYARVEQLLQRALAIKEKHSLKPDQDLANIAITLGAVYGQQRKLAKAEPLLRRALSILEGIKGDAVSIATVNQDLGGLYYIEGNYHEAEKSFKSALDVILSSKAASSLAAITTYSLGLVYSAQAKYAEAEIWLKRAIDLAEKTMGKTHPTYAVILDGLAGAYKAQDKFGEAGACQRL